MCTHCLSACRMILADELVPPSRTLLVLLRVRPSTEWSAKIPKMIFRGADYCPYVVRAALKGVCSCAAKDAEIVFVCGRGSHLIPTCLPSCICIRNHTLRHCHLLDHCRAVAFPCVHLVPASSGTASLELHTFTLAFTLAAETG